MAKFPNTAMDWSAMQRGVCLSRAFDAARKGCQTECHQHYRNEDREQVVRLADEDDDGANREDCRDQISSAMVSLTNQSTVSPLCCKVCSACPSIDRADICQRGKLRCVLRNLPEYS